MNKSRTLLLLKLLPLYAFSALVLAWPWFYSNIQSSDVRASNQQYLSINQTSSEAPLVEDKPTELAVPRLNLKLAVTEGYYYKYNQSWTLSEDKTHYAVMTALPNNKKGHTLIYGHATKQVLLPTGNLVEGDQLILTLENGQKLEYFYSGATKVNPTNTDILRKATDLPELTLMTCDGAFFQQRRQMTFSFLRVLPPEAQ